MAMNDPKKLVEYLFSDLRALSTEARKKYTHVKDAAESCLVKIRNISGASESHALLQNIRSSCTEIMHPFLLSCSTKNPKLVQIALYAIQHMLQYRVVSADSAPAIVNELHNLSENQCEELRILQTLTPFVSAEVLVTGTSLAKCIALAIHLSFSKDPSVINAANAAIRQLFECVFERVIQEDGMKGAAELTIVPQTVLHQTQNSAQYSVPPTLRPCAADGYLLLRDLTALIRKEKPAWLDGVRHISLTLALELLETILRNYPSIFFKHSEYADMLKNSICPQLVKLFAGDRDIRTLQCEILLSYLLELLSPEHTEWQPAAALEVLHKLIVQPDLIAWFCENYDMQPNTNNLIEQIITKLKTFILKLLQSAIDDALIRERDLAVVNGSSQTGFVYHGSFTPLYENLSAKRWVILDWLEKNDPAAVPEGYSLSVSYYSIVDITHSIYAVVEEENSPTFRQHRSSSVDLPKKHKELASQLFKSSYAPLLDGLNILLEASIDDSISEAILNCISTVVLLSCRTADTDGRDFSVRCICRASLPQGYFAQFIEQSAQQIRNGAEEEPKSTSSDITTLSAGEPSQVIAMGTVCPTPKVGSNQLALTVMLTAKNMQVARLLITTAQSNGQNLNESWDLVLTTLQHLFWILGMKPTSAGGFRSGSSASSSVQSSESTASAANVAIVTTALSSELPNLNQMLNKLFSSTADYSDVSLHHVIAALCKLSSETMTVAAHSYCKEPSFFAVAKILLTALANVRRLTIFWKPISAHLLEICSHSNPLLRDWGCVALTTMVKTALQSVSTKNEEEEITETDLVRLQTLILTPLASMSESEHIDVRSKQIDCLMHILQSDKHIIQSQLWPLIIKMATDIVENKQSTSAELVDQGFAVVKLIIKDFLNSLPFDCVQMVVEMDSKYGHQKLNMNISLASVGLLWDMSDYVSREGSKHNQNHVEQMWLVIYNCLSELCVDSRPPIRKSACDTLLQTVAAHGHLLNSRTWSHMIWKIMFPMLDRVRVETRNASTQRTGGAGLGATNIMIHHSRDTESKQWAETTVRTLSGVVKIFNAQRTILLTLDNFGACWKNLLAYIEYVAGTDNSEMSLAALKNFQELLFGRAQGVSSDGTKKSPQEEIALPLPEKMWIVSWNAWIRVALAIVSPTVPEKSLFAADTPAEGLQFPKHYIPGSFHFTTLLSAFQPLFYRVSKQLELGELKSEGVLSIFEAIVSTPLSSEQGPFMMHATNSDISPPQECILDSLYVLYQKEMEPNSTVVSAIPDLLHTLLYFVSFSIRPPESKFLPEASKDGQISWSQQNLIAFAELSLRTCVSYYSAVAKFPTVIEKGTFVEIIRGISEPLSRKYQCPAQTTWKVAATALINVCKVGLPIARERVHDFASLWDILASTFEEFLFTTSKSETPLNADERKRHEFVDCQIVDLIRSELLPYADCLPRDFMQRLIDILNRGSINTMDPTDVMASDSFQQRADLSRVCFDALLSMSRGADAADSQSTSTDSTQRKSLLGATAISSLLNRCKQVLNNYARDEQSSGHFRLPQERIFEVISVLRAVATLIDGLAKEPEATHSSLYSHLAGLHPNLVQMIPSCRSDQQVELALMTALNSYQTLLLLNIHSKP